MKHLYTVFSATFLSLVTVACSQSTAETSAETAGQPKIVITTTGVMVNSKPLNRPATLAQVQSVLGMASRVKTDSPAEMAEKKRTMGVVSNTIYTYDKLGITVYQKPGSKYVGSLDIDFKNEGLPFSPSNDFTGTITIGGKAVDKDLSLSELRSLPGMEVGESIIKKHTVKYGSQNLFFDFGHLNESDNLVGVEIELGPRVETNAHGWSTEDLTMMKAVMSNAPQMQAVASKFGVSSKALADCFATKVSGEMTKSRMQAPNTQDQAKLQAMMEACVIESAKY